MNDEIYHFSFSKNLYLMRERGMGFKQVIEAIEGDGLLDILPHPNTLKYPQQSVYVVNINNYAHVVPFVRRSEREVFLKTVFPHRKLTKFYRERGQL